MILKISGNVDAIKDKEAILKRLTWVILLSFNKNKTIKIHFIGAIIP